MEGEFVNATHDTCKKYEKLPNSTNTNCFTLEALVLIREAQQQNGLRHADYQRYRGYCSRRLKRIRKSLQFPQGGRNKVTPRKISADLLTDVRFLQLPLFSAERCWAFAMQLKSEANTEPRKRFHLVSRLKKAARYSGQLVGACESSKCDVRTKLESQAYDVWINGCLQFELECWKPALEHFTQARTIYGTLADAFSGTCQAVYRQRVDEITPSLRYCTYNIGGDDTALLDLQKMRVTSGDDQLSSKLDQLLSQTRDKRTDEGHSEVTWRGRTVPVRVEAVRLCLRSMADVEKGLEVVDSDEGKISVYETLLKQCIEAQEAMRESLPHDAVVKIMTCGGQRPEGVVDDHHFLYSYLTYLRLKTAVGRNMLLIEQLRRQSTDRRADDGQRASKPQALARLYDTIIQNLGEILSLPGVEDDLPMKQEIDVCVFVFKAFRLSYVARVYVAARKWTEAMALCQRTLEYVGCAENGYRNIHVKDVQLKVLDLPTSEVTVERLLELRSEVNGMAYFIQANSILDADSVNDAPSVDVGTPLADRLDEYYEDGSLASRKPYVAHFPPDFQPIPCRPLFYDLALNHVVFPSLEDRLEMSQDKVSSSRVGGLTSFVRGWLWGKGDEK